MEFTKLAGYCNEQLKFIEDFLGDHDVFREVYEGRMETRDVYDFLVRFNFERRDSVDAIISRYLLDLQPAKSDAGTLLFMKLRLECSIFNLQLLNQTLDGHATLHRKTDPEETIEEAMFWALTGLWNFGCYNFLARASRCYCAGLRSALEPHIPGTQDPGWMDPKRKR